MTKIKEENLIAEILYFIDNNDETTKMCLVGEIMARMQNGDLDKFVRFWKWDCYNCENKIITVIINVGCKTDNFQCTCNNCQKTC